MVLTYRPGTVKKIVDLRGILRPRDPVSPEFAQALRQLTSLVAEEQLRHERDESALGAI